MLSELYGIYAAKLHTVGIGLTAVQLGGVLRQGIGLNTEVRSEPVSGEPYSRFAAVYSQKPQTVLTTRHVGLGLATTGVFGMPITSDGSHPGIVLYGQKAADGGTRASGGVHRSFTASKGIMVPVRLTCEHQGDAELEYMILPTWDQQNDILTVSDTVALPAIDTYVERFSLGPVTLGGVSITGFNRLEINFGLNAATFGAESYVWDTLSKISEGLPTIALTGLNPKWLKSDAVPLIGLPCTHLNTSIWLRQRENSQTFYGDGEEVHIVFTANGVATIGQALDGSGTGNTETALMVHATYDGTNVPLTFDFDQAIS